VAWLTGSQKKKERAPMLELVASGAAALVVGTHAVIQDRCSSRTWRWPSSTSSTGSAWRSGWRLREQDDRRPAKARSRTC
jgi:hypothetical protein